MYSKTTEDLLKTLLRTDEYSQFQELKDNGIVSLAEHLDALLDQKETSKAEVVYRARLDTVYGYQIFNGTRSYLLMMVIAASLLSDTDMRNILFMPFPS